MALPLSIRETVAAIRSGHLNPRQVVEDCLAKIDKYESRVHAWVMVDAEGARQQAERIEQDVKSGNPLGPLAGVTIGVKDIIDVGGWPTKAGSPLREHHVAEQDAPIVAALRRAGAIILGKTVTTQFACFDPPPTRNPWNLDHTPGGSSSGSAAAVALGMCHAALGTQTGGSILRPAAYCGVVGFKPTYDSLDMRGIVPVSFHLDHVGFLARHASDIAVLQHVAHYSANSRFSIEWTGLKSIGEVAFNYSPQPPRFLAVVNDCYADLQPDWLRTGFANCLEVWQRNGVVIVPTELPMPLEQIRRCHRVVMAVEAANYHAPDFAAYPESFAPAVAGLIREGKAVSRDEYVAALATRRIWELRLSRADILPLVLPATLDDAPALTERSTGDPRCNSPFSFSGHPAITIPCGLSPENLPWGIQFVLDWRADRSLISMAHWCAEQIPALPVPSISSEGL